MKTKVLITAAVFLASIGSAYAAPIDCRTLSNLQQFIDQNAAGGCFVQDKLFTNFSYDGGGGITAPLVNVGVVFSALPGQDIHGFTLTPGLGIEVWRGGFSFGYSIAIDPPSTTVQIVGAKLQINLGVIANPTTAQSTKSNGLIQNALFGNESVNSTFSGVPSLNSLTVVNIPSGGANPGFLISLEEDYIQATQNTVPEPFTIFLAGSGLVALGIARRRRK